MAYIINAWLDCPHPFLTVTNTFSGKEVINIKEQELHQILENGDICIEDLFSTDRHQLEEVVRELAMFSCRQSLAQPVSPGGRLL